MADKKTLNKYLKQAKAAIEEQKFEDAYEALQEALDIAETYQALCFCGLAAFNLKKFNECETNYKKAGALDPDKAMAWKGLLEYYESQQAQAEKLELPLGRMIDITKNKGNLSKSCSFTVQLAEAQTKSKSFAKAIESWKSVLQLISGDISGDDLPNPYSVCVKIISLEESVAKATVEETIASKTAAAKEKAKKAPLKKGTLAKDVGKVPAAELAKIESQAHESSLQQSSLDHAYKGLLQFSASQPDTLFTESGEEFALACHALNRYCERVHKQLLLVDSEPSLWSQLVQGCGQLGPQWREGAVQVAEVLLLSRLWQEGEGDDSGGGSGSGSAGDDTSMAQAVMAVAEKALADGTSKQSCTASIPATRIVLGRKALRDGDVAGACKLLEQACAAVGPGDAVLAHVHLARARLLPRSGCFLPGVAADAARKAMKALPAAEGKYGGANIGVGRTALQLLLARAQVAMGQSDAARETYRAILGLPPDVPSEEEGAGTGLSAVVPSNPEPAAYLGLAELALGADDPAQAEAYLDSCLAASSGGVRVFAVRALRGWVLCLQGKAAAALNELEELSGEAAAATPPAQVPRLHYYLGRAYWALGGETRTDKKKCHHQLLKAAQQDPADSEPFTWLAHWYQQVGVDRKRAEKCFQKAVKLDPQNADAGDSLSDMLLASGKEKTALKLWESSTRADGQAKWAWMRLGYLRLAEESEAMMKIGERGGAGCDAVAAAVASAVAGGGSSSSSGSSSSGSSAGAASEELGASANAAIVCFQQALRVDSSDARCWAALGKSYFTLGKHMAALKAYQRCMELCAGGEAQPTPGTAAAAAAKNNNNNNNNNAAASAGVSGGGDGDEASSACCAKWEVWAGRAWALCEMGEVEAGLGMYSEAVVHLRWAVELQPDNPLAHYLVGSALLGRAQREAQDSRFVRCGATLRDGVTAALTCQQQQQQQRGEGEEEAAGVAVLKLLGDLYTYAYFSSADAFATAGEDGTVGTDGGTNLLAFLEKGAEAFAAVTQICQCKLDAANARANSAANETAQAAAQAAAAAAYFDLGLNLLYQGQAERALCGGGSGVFRHAYEQGLGHGRLHRAVCAFRDALRTDPMHVPAWNALGVSEQRPLVQQASFVRCLQLEPEPAAWGNLAMLYLHWHSPRLARQALLSLQRVNPDSPAMWIGYALLHELQGEAEKKAGVGSGESGESGAGGDDGSAMTAVSSKAQAQASAAFSCALQMEPWPEALLGFGCTALRHAPTAASVALRRYARRDSCSPVCFNTLGLALERLGQTAEAHAAFARAAAILDGIGGDGDGDGVDAAALRAARMGVAMNNGRVLLRLAYEAKAGKQEEQRNLAEHAIEQFSAAMALTAGAEDKLHVRLGLACSHAVGGDCSKGVAVLQDALGQAQGQAQASGRDVAYLSVALAKLQYIQGDYDSSAFALAQAKESCGSSSSGGSSSGSGDVVQVCQMQIALSALRATACAGASVSDGAAELQLLQELRMRETEGGRVPSQQSFLLQYHMLRANGDLLGARKVMSKAVHQHPCSASLWNSLGLALVEDVQTTEAKMRKAAVKRAKKKKKDGRRILGFEELPTYCSAVERSLCERGVVGSDGAATTAGGAAGTGDSGGMAAGAGGTVGRSVASEQATMVGAVEPDRERLRKEKATLLLQGYSQLSCSMGAAAKQAEAPEQGQGGGEAEQVSRQLLAAKKLLHVDPTAVGAWRLAALAEVNERQLKKVSKLGPAAATYLRMQMALE